VSQAAALGFLVHELDTATSFPYMGIRFVLCSCLYPMMIIR
jgi:hypothetical protein